MTALDTPNAGYASGTLQNGDVLPHVATVSSTSLTITEWASQPTPGTPTGTLTKATYYFSKLGSRWWGCTPLGNVTYFSGMDTFTYGNANTTWSTDNVNYQYVVTAKYKSGPGGNNNTGCNWAYASVVRLQQWGFNLIGEDSDNTYSIPSAPNPGCWGGDGTVPAAVRMGYIYKTPWTHYANFNHNSPGTTPGSVHNVLSLYKTSVVNGIYIRGIDDYPDPNATQFLAHAVYGTSPYRQFTGPHHEYLAFTVPDESDDMGMWSAGSDTNAVLPCGGGNCSTGGPVYPPPASPSPPVLWYRTACSNAGTAGSLGAPCQLALGQNQYIGTVGTNEDMHYAILILFAAPNMAGAKAVTYNHKAWGDDQAYVNVLTVCSSGCDLKGSALSLSGGTLTITGVPGANIWNNQTVWMVNASSDVSPSSCTGPSGCTAVGSQTLSPGVSPIGPVTLPCASCVTPSSTSTLTLITPNIKFEFKYDLSNWLQGVAEQMAGVSASRSGTTVTLTLPPTHSFNVHSELTLSGCSDPSFNTAAGSPVTVTTRTATSVTYTQSGKASATGCSVGEGPGYALAGLNAAWGSNYDTLGTDASAYTSTTLSTSNNTTYSGTLATPVTPGSVEILVNGAMMAGDDATGIRASTLSQTGNFRSCQTSPSHGSSPCVAGQKSVVGASSTINYSTGAVTVTFSAALSGTPTMTAAYTTGGWAEGGKGLLDEDGTCPSKTGATCWLPLTASCCANTNQQPFQLYPLTVSNHTLTSQFQADMDAYLFHMAKHYAIANSTPVRAIFPGVMYAIEDPGAYGTPPNHQLLWSVGEYSDFFEEYGSANDFTTTGGQGSTVVDWQARHDFYAAYLGDMPWFDGFYFFSAWNDSYFQYQPNQPANTSSVDFATQAYRGNAYASKTSRELNFSISSGCQTYNSACNLAGTYPYVGHQWYAWVDDYVASPTATGGEWGMVDPRDDAYDGFQSKPSADTYTAGGYTYESGCQGQDARNGSGVYGGHPCEPGASGNFIGPVTAANSYWLNAVGRRLKTTRGASGQP
jgi:hypothetical protein